MSAHDINRDPKRRNCPSHYYFIPLFIFLIELFNQFRCVFNVLIFYYSYLVSLLVITRCNLGMLGQVRNLVNLEFAQRTPLHFYLCGKEHIGH